MGRLKRRAEFLRVASARHRSVAPGLIVQARKRPVDQALVADQVVGNGVRVGFTVSRKVGNAVARNRARRRLRAVVAQVLPSGGKAGYDLVVIGRGATLKRPFPALLIDFETALKRLGAYEDLSCGSSRQ